MISKGILGTKGATDQRFDSNGDRIPVTRINTSPCYVAGMRTMDADGYWSLRIGFGETKKIKKSAHGVVEKAGIKTPLRFLREIRFDTAEAVTEGRKKGLKVGETIFWVGQELKSTDMFAADDHVDITGTSKGKGFQGVVKRHGFAGGPRTHGQSDRERAPGSIGMSADPGRLFKGKKMAGRMGGDTITVQNLRVVDVDEDGLFVKGLIPGVPGGLLMIRSHDPVRPTQADEEEKTDSDDTSINGVSEKEESSDKEKPDTAENTDKSEEETQEVAAEKESAGNEEEPADNAADQASEDTDKGESSDTQK